MKMFLESGSKVKSLDENAQPGELLALLWIIVIESHRHYYN